MRRTVLLATILVALALCVGVAQADVLYNTIPGYDAGQGTTIVGPDWMFKGWLPYRACAQPFTVGEGNFSLISVEIAAFLGAGSPSVRLAVLADNSGVPGIEIESLGTMSTTQSASIIQFNSSTHPLLEAEQRYWVGVFPGGADTWAAWCYVGSGTEGLSAEDKGSGWTGYEGGLCAMRVEADPAAPVVPEIPAATLAPLGLAVLGLIRRRFAA